MGKMYNTSGIGERGSISENSHWIISMEALTLSPDVERWFIRMERASMVQYHMDEAMGDVLSVMEVEETDDHDKLKSTLFTVFSNPVSTFIWGPEETDVLSGKT
ncbi:hypothetical protein T03_11492 [Trichinella britovi]|uniref:Uncharacterized protein n=2 Tax=Trichinella TaxID=6333 RepID=A0A0V1D4T9_TRIBR|nr:hypothetical protein T05_4431 [Trichinella murrelli]KRY56537.1 hypothetical protein T03_11492 [Trichinella britovi]